MRIAIFGARGFIGKTLVASAPSEHELLLLNRPEGDVRKPESFTKKLKNFKPDVVINLSALIGTLLSSLPVREMFETNTLGALNVAYAAHEAGAKSHIFISSTVVHGESKIGEPLSRFSPFAPKHPYSASKAAAEYGLEQFAKEQKQMAVISLRPPMVIGAETDLPLPPIEFVRDIKAGKEIRIFGDGLHKREFVSVKDVALGIWKAAAWSITAEKGYQPFFLTGNPVSMKDLAERAVKKFGGNVLYIPKTLQTFSLITDPSDSKRLFDWQADDDLDSILDDVGRHV